MKNLEIRLVNIEDLEVPLNPGEFSLVRDDEENEDTLYVGVAVEEDE